MEVSDSILRTLYRKGLRPDRIAEATGLLSADVSRRLGISTRPSREDIPLLADPNELLIMLEASALRQHWTPAREAHARGSILTGWTPPDADRELCRLMRS